MSLLSHLPDPHVPPPGDPLEGGRGAPQDRGLPRLVEILESGVEELLEQSRLPVALDLLAPLRLPSAQSLGELGDGGRCLQILPSLLEADERGLRSEEHTS